ncbi:MAG TPA: hypothetical protein VFV50_11725 [Bdellovibrionales bacterium]|nr:hypothetical protein [Bdellovibrionales bacterium]
MRICVALMALWLAGCHDKNNEVICAIPNMAYAAHVSVRLACPSEFVEDELVIVMNGKIVLDERDMLPGPTPTPFPYDRTYRERERLWIYPYDADDSTYTRLQTVELKVYRGACELTADDGSQRPGLYRIAQGTINTELPYDDGKRCWASAQEMIAAQTLACELPVCEELP